ncbi:unnamed protein product [Psylliodes chrysocephalus]|uniref:Uncharacterized protein n=1 Tax=Psylliodes chrysocephalus TaxID=3402493 RepID=A0A9P0G7S6_9CUCU|nr:unnamed protein product [Psylliodes chrysocephala]
MIHKNPQPNMGPSLTRPATSLRTKYEGFKKDLRKKVAAQKQALYGTGGGPWTEPDLSTNEYKIYGLISISVDGLESRFDDDDLPCGVNNIQRNINNDDDEDDDDTIANMQIVENIEIVVDNTMTADDGAKHQVRAGTSREFTTEDQKRSWTKWKPSDLKRNVSTPLSVKRRRIVSRPEATEKVTILAESKKVVMDLQAESLKLDVEFKKKNMHLNYANLRRN